MLLEELGGRGGRRPTLAHQERIHAVHLVSQVDSQCSSCLSNTEVTYT